MSFLCCAIKSPQSGMTLYYCFQFMYAAAAASHIKTICAKLWIFGTNKAWIWRNVLDDISMALIQGHGCGIH